eukprot:CAMPEP_0170652520 /NCGR_PEP_ID=MMETSP0224-20130122/46944_1 /TAXON_ID=285029 /ORGANISM="Togula jolla, Strain CCCM 725" /LENGTH=41 /DNA_ID= /DNA_START= /DNA_END= /DNA_ORIENTATION=
MWLDVSQELWQLAAGRWQLAAGSWQLAASKFLQNTASRSEL